MAISLHRPLCMASRSAGPLFLYRATPISHALALAPAQPALNHVRLQTRRSSSSSNIPGLTPPWQFCNLSSIERKAYERFGPSYLAQMAPKDLEFAKYMATMRAEKAAEYEAAYGSDWYDIMQEATRLKDEAEKGPVKRMLQAVKEEGGGRDAKSALKLAFYAEMKASKGERMRKAMDLVAQNRKQSI